MNAQVQSAVATQSAVLRQVPLNGEVPETARLAKHKLERIVEAGRANAGRVVEHVLSSTPEDALVRGDALEVRADAESLTLATAGSSWSLHTNALGQLCERIGLPLAYAKALHRQDEVEHGATKLDRDWSRRLLTTNFRELLQHGPDRHLVRSIKGQARAVLSDRYGRLDSRPLLDAFIGACDSIGAKPYEGVATDLSASVRAIIPTVFEPVAGEYLVFGIAWLNGDYGTRAYSLAQFSLRLQCLNGAVGANELKQVHLGGRLPDNISFSAQTHQLDCETLVSATQDVVRSTLDSAAVARKLDVVRRAHATEIDWSAAWRRVSRELGKAEQKTLRDSFEGPDVVNLPAGRTMWRLSNVLSWMAHGLDDGDGERKLDLERLAGALLPEAT